MYVVCKNNTNLIENFKNPLIYIVLHRNMQCLCEIFNLHTININPKYNKNLHKALEICLNRINTIYRFFINK